jgi:hypothetical protein
MARELAKVDMATFDEVSALIRANPQDDAAICRALAKIHEVPPSVMVKAATTFDTLIENLRQSDFVEAFGAEVLTSDRGLGGFKWDVIVDIAKGMQ